MNPDSTASVTVSRSQLEAFCLRLCRQLDIDDELSIDWINTAIGRDVRGDFGRGLARLPGVIERVASGQWPNRLAVQVERPANLSARVTSERGGWPDQLGRRAATIASEIAKTEGAGIVACPSPTIAGALLQPIIAAGQIGIVMVQNPPMLGSGQGGPNFVGNNPIAVGTPGDPPFIFDAALSQWSVFTLTEEVRRTGVVPPDALIDAEGHPVTDPSVVDDWGHGNYDTGALAPLGGIKGWGLALSLEILAGALTGGFGEPARGKEWGSGTLILALSPALFGEYGALGRLQTYLDQLPSYPGRHHQEHSSSEAPSADRLRYPGWVLERLSDAASRHGITDLPSWQSSSDTSSML